MRKPDEALVLVVREFIQDIGIVGLAAAILALMVIALRRFIVALFDWPSRDKTRAERDKEWEAWDARRKAALDAGKDFNEPSPAEKKRMQPA